MSTTEGDESVALDAAAIKKLVQEMSQQELAIFRDVIVDIKKLGAGISQSAVDGLAKKYADKARRLAGDGGK
jgi:hypothetical protein